MTIPSPNLDDRDWQDLVDEARSVVVRHASTWTDVGPSDPGMALIEAFAHLTDILLYRLNRVPDKLFVEFLNILGASLRPPFAASVDLEFARSEGVDGEIAISRGTRVGVEGTEGDVVFSVVADTVLQEGEERLVARAVHGEFRDAVLVGVSSGEAGQSFDLEGAPLAHDTDGAGVTVAVEVADESAAVVRVGDRAFAAWEEVDAFLPAHRGRMVCVVDRVAGRVLFAPSELSTGEPLAAVPEAGAEVRVWTYTGGGDDGNVGAGRLTHLRDAVGGIAVVNPAPATGGRDIEELEAALSRAVHDLQSRGHAVTRSDYELLTLHAGGEVSRARAFTRLDTWAFAQPGEVEVVLVPRLPAAERRLAVTRDRLAARQTDEAQRRVVATLDERRPLGTRCLVNWCKYKSVAVHATVVVEPGVDRASLREQLDDRVNALLSPFPSEIHPEGRAFGAALRASNVYRALEIPGVRHVENLRFDIEESPHAAVVAVRRDRSQPSTYFSAAEGDLYRTVNDGAGWERIVSFPAELIVSVVPFSSGALSIGERPDRPGLIAMVSRSHSTDSDTSQLRVSEDLGESWSRVIPLEFEVSDIAWTVRGGRAVLLVAGENALYQVDALTGENRVQVAVDDTQPTLGFRAVETFRLAKGDIGAALLANDGRLFLSLDATEPNGFRGVESVGDVRCLAVERGGPVTWLWVGLAAPDDPTEGGCLRLRMDDLASGWDDMSDGWAGGTVRSLAIESGFAVAGTQSGGVVRRPTNDSGQWTRADVNSGLPLRDATRFDPVLSISLDAESGLIIAGTDDGLFRSTDGGQRFAAASGRSVVDDVTVPDTWLIVSGAHELKIRGLDEI